MTSAPGQWPGHSALVVPIRSLETLIRGRHAFYDAAYVSPDPTFAHAHVTVLAPFLPLAALCADSGTIEHSLDTDRIGRTGSAHGRMTLARLAAQLVPFDVTFRSVATFPNGIIHLVPEPAEPLRELTRAACRAFPGLSPYAGAFGSTTDAVAPHLTVDAIGPAVSEESVRDWVTAILPLRHRVDRLQVSWYEPWRCHTVGSWHLGPAPGTRDRPANGPAGAGTSA